MRGAGTRTGPNTEATLGATRAQTRAGSRPTPSSSCWLVAAQGDPDPALADGTESGSRRNGHAGVRQETCAPRHGHPRRSHARRPPRDRKPPGRPGRECPLPQALPRRRRGWSGNAPVRCPRSPAGRSAPPTRAYWEGGRHAGNDRFHDVVHLPLEARRANQRTDAEAGQPVCLGQRQGREDPGLAGNVAVEAGRADVRNIEGEGFVAFVRDDPEIVADGQFHELAA